MKIVVEHRFNAVNKQRQSRSLISKTVPNQAPDLRFIIAQIQNGQAVSVLDMRADKDASLDDIDLRFVSTKMNTSETLDAMLQDLNYQNSALGDVGNSQEFPYVDQSTTEEPKQEQPKKEQPKQEQPKTSIEEGY